MLRVLGTAAGVPAEVMARIAAAESAAAEANGRAEAARLEAVKAEATGQNARQMVLTRDPKLNQVSEQYDTLEELAASYSAALPASIADRAAIHAELTALTARVAALEALKVMVAFGTVTLSGSLLGGASRDVVVPLSRDMTTAIYSAGSSLSGGTSLLGQLVHDGIVTQTKTTVTVRVRNTGLTSIANLSAAVVYVVAAREG